MRIGHVALALALVSPASPAVANQMWGVVGDNVECTMIGPKFNVIVRWERGSSKVSATFRSEAFIPLVGKTRIFHWAFAWPHGDPVSPTWSMPSKVVEDRHDITVPRQAGYRTGAIVLTQDIDPFLTRLAEEDVIQIYTDDAGDSLWLTGSADGVRLFRECMREVR